MTTILMNITPTGEESTAWVMTGVITFIFICAIIILMKKYESS